MAAAQRMPTTFETAILRSRKSLSGTSGSLTLASIARKSASRAAEPTSAPIVRVEDQPCSLPFTIA
jgi:hypothetical protein